MSTSKRKLKSVARCVARDPRRSPLFHWLLENFDVLEPGVAGPRSDWAPLRALAIADGITDDDGNEPTGRTVRRTMGKVRREVAARGAAKGRPAPPEVPPSRLPASVRPPVEPPRAPATPRPVPPRHTASPPAAKEDLPPEVRAKLAALQDQFDYVDRYVRPPKREE